MRILVAPKAEVAAQLGVLWAQLVAANGLPRLHARVLSTEKVKLVYVSFPRVCRRLGELLEKHWVEEELPLLVLVADDVPADRAVRLGELEPQHAADEQLHVLQRLAVLDAIGADGHRESGEAVRRGGERRGAVAAGEGGVELVVQRVDRGGREGAQRGEDRRDEVVAAVAHRELLLERRLIQFADAAHRVSRLHGQLHRLLFRPPNHIVGERRGDRRERLLPRHVAQRERAVHVEVQHDLPRRRAYARLVVGERPPQRRREHLLLGEARALVEPPPLGLAGEAEQVRLD
mmetsp:Transcript_11268/g.27051  ORF Transcript_11268/g.27051 Transcript_11268/m.27051 type:complete len:290 (+) Transcript_11268:593-1462(+)